VIRPATTNVDITNSAYRLHCPTQSFDIHIHNTLTYEVR
jgi:hypothetical protein